MNYQLMLKKERNSNYAFGSYKSMDSLHVGIESAEDKPTNRLPSTEKTKTGLY